MSEKIDWSRPNYVPVVRPLPSRRSLSFEESDARASYDLKDQRLLVAMESLGTMSEAQRTVAPHWQDPNWPWKYEIQKEVVYGLVSKLQEKAVFSEQPSRDFPGDRLVGNLPTCARLL